MPRFLRAGPTIVCLALCAAACSGVGVESIDAGPTAPVGASALDDPADPTLPAPLIDLNELLSGGPPPDGIPAIDEPRFVSTPEVDFLDDREPVLAIDVGGERRAYPVQIMTWHEIVNDEVGGIPVAVSYCPLCNSAVAYDRSIDGRLLDFGTSGLLYNSSLVMYDRQTESLWTHFNAEAVAGTLTGTELDTFALSTVAWADWRDANPDGLVLSRDTGFDRDYGRNPYAGYDNPEDDPFLFRGDTPDDLEPKARVIGLGQDGADPVALPLDRAMAAGVTEVDVDGQAITVWVKPGTGSALDSPTVGQGRDVGAVGTFIPEVDGQALTFGRDGDAFIDVETGSIWSIFGTARAGELVGAQLEAVPHLDTFWFAWAAFSPETRIQA